MWIRDRSMTRCPTGDACTAERGPCCDKETDRASAGVCDRMQFGMHAALGQSNQAAFPPFFNRRLDAVRCALRSVASIETVLLSGACSAGPIMIRANTPISLPLTGNTCAACVRGGASSDYTVSSAALLDRCITPRRRGSARSCLDTSTGRLIGPTARNVSYPIAIDEYNATQYPKVIHASTTSALWKLRPQPLHLRLSQPIQIARDILQQLGIMNHGNATSSTS